MRLLRKKENGKKIESWNFDDILVNGKTESQKTK